MFTLGGKGLEADPALPTSTPGGTGWEGDVWCLGSKWSHSDAE